MVESGVGHLAVKAFVGRMEPAKFLGLLRLAGEAVVALYAGVQIWRAAELDCFPRLKAGFAMTGVGGTNGLAAAAPRRRRRLMLG